MNKREKGTEQEIVAANYLKKNGYVILEQNYRCRSGELDIVARDGVTLVFAEVKTRRVRAGRRPGDNLSARQFRRDLRAAGRFVKNYASPEYRRRFEVIEVWFGRWFCQGIVRHIRYVDDRAA